MNTIKLNIKEIVQNNLISEMNRRDYLNESFVKIKDFRGDKLINEYMKTSVTLMNEGFTFEEIETHINEIDNPLDKLDGKVDWGGMFKDSLYSSAKEYAIKWILNYIGVGPQISTSLAQFFAEVTPLDLLRPFKNEQYCTMYLPKIMNGALEVIVRYLGAKMTGTDRTNYEWSGLGSVGVGNLFGEAIKESKVGKAMSDKLCKVLH